MKRNYILILSLFIAVFVTESCKHNPPGQNKPLVVVSILPLQYLVDNISGGAVATMVMLPPGTSHEAYDPAPRQMAALAQAQIYFTTGHTAFDNIWLPNLAEHNPQMKIKVLTDGIALISGDACHGHHEEHHEEHGHGVDPHYWLSPRSFRQMATGVFNELSLLFPEHQADFKHRYDSITSVISAIDSTATNELGALKNRRFMVFHPALAYFALDYNLEQVAIEQEGKTPGAMGLKKIIDQARADTIRVILVQREYDTAVASSIAKEIGGKTMQFDPMAYNWPENMNAIIKILGNSLPK